MLCWQGRICLDAQFVHISSCGALAVILKIDEKPLNLCRCHTGEKPHSNKQLLRERTDLKTNRTLFEQSTLHVGLFASVMTNYLCFAVFLGCFKFARVPLRFQLAKILL